MSSIIDHQKLDYINIVKNGTYFHRPEQRYHQGVCITCDRCQQSRIQTGFGFGKTDLCMECVHKINAQYKIIDNKSLKDIIFNNTPLMMEDHKTCPPLPKLEPGIYTEMEQKQFDCQCNDQYTYTMMEQRQYRPGNVRTNMEQRQYRPGNVRTNMEQRQYRPGNSPLTFMKQDKFKPANDFSKNNTI